MKRRLRLRGAWPSRRRAAARQGHARAGCGGRAGRGRLLQPRQVRVSVRVTGRGRVRLRVRVRVP